ncbi:MAG: 50S ribosomal protein L30 [Sphaerochaetaceae bacterium]
MADKKLKVTLTGSVVGALPKQRKTVKALGFGKRNSSVIIDNTPDMLGMVNVISHLVKVEEM